MLAGTRLGAYEVIGPLGRGAMGEVYRARDLKLNREVAIKVLPQELMADPDRRHRFEREAQLLASLNHPHIAHIHGFEDATGTPALVMELVEGPTVAERIARGPIALGDSLEIAAQIAEGMAAAHDRGIIHRDLKPANVKVSTTGAVKVLDFGIAKAIDAGREALDTVMTMPATEAGVIVGTASYMSPEQACGKPVDHRTDVWAFGCLLYEMLTGQRAFTGGTTAEILAGVLEREPDWSALAPGTPVPLRRLLRRCLEKDVNKRLRDIGDARFDLLDMRVGDVSATESRARPSLSALIPGLLVASAVAAIAVAGWMLMAGSRREAAPPPIVRFSIPMPGDAVLSSTFNKQLSISRDGRRVAFVGLERGRRSLHVRHLDRAASDAVAGGGNGNAPQFSTDGQSIIYAQVGHETLARLALRGGAPVAVTKFEGMRGTAVATDGTIVYAEGGGSLVRVPPDGGNSTTLLAPNAERGERSFVGPVFLPGDHALIFSVASTDVERFDEGRVDVLDSRTNERRTLIRGGMDARYSPSGHLVYAHHGSLHAVAFDLARLQVTGEPVKVLDGVFMSVTTGQAEFDISLDGTLVYAPGPSEGGDRRLVWVDRTGKPDPLPLPPRGYLHPRLSPDEQHLAVEVEGASHDLYTYEFARGLLTKLTFDGVSHWPLWMPKGDQLTFRSSRFGPFTMWRMPVDRSGPDERLATGERQSPASWSPDGTAVAFTQSSPGTSADVYVLPTGADAPSPFAQSRFAEGAPRFSPDGRWVAYTSNESGRPEIYAQPWPGPGPKIQISTNGGTDAVWSRQGGELFYRQGDDMMSAAVHTGDRLTVARPVMLWSGRYSHGMSTSCGPPGPTSSNYDVNADGTRFLMVEDSAQGVVAHEIHVIVNWAHQLGPIK